MFHGSVHAGKDFQHACAWLPELSIASPAVHTLVHKDHVLHPYAMVGVL